MKFDEYLKYDAMGLAQLVKSRQVSPSELLELAISRAEEINPQLNAVVLKHYDYARNLAKNGVPHGVLAGVPFLLKDLFIDLEGTTTSSGCAFLKDTVARADSTVAARYKQAGLVIFGKTHSPELGGGPTTESQLYGVTLNPWNLSVTPSGSSGGSAAAIAAGVVPAAHGSDAGGSIRMPAAVTGLFGLKPTRGRVPLGPTRFDGGGGIATIHALTRSVRDSACLLDIESGPEAGALYGTPMARRSFVVAAAEDPKPLRIALNLTSTSGGITDPHCIAAAMDAAAKLKSLGHHVEEASPSLDLELYLRARKMLRAATYTAAIKGVQRALGKEGKPSDFEASTWQSSLEGMKVTGADILGVREAMFTLHKQVVSFMEKFDVILSPTTQRLGPRPGLIDAQQISEEAEQQINRFVAFTMLYNFTGQPSMSVPLYWTEDNMPVGVQFSGRFEDEDLLFSLAGQLERAYPWFDRLAPQPYRTLGG
jgi:amidase